MNSVGGIINPEMSFKDPLLKSRPIKPGVNFNRFLSILSRFDPRLNLGANQLAEIFDRPLTLL